MKNSNLSSNFNPLRGMHNEKSPYYQSVRLAHQQAEEGKLHFDTALAIIKVNENAFNELHERTGVVFCKKYSIRILADKAYTARDVKSLAYLVSKAKDFVIQMQEKGSYQPSHTKTLAHTLYRYALVLLNKGFYDLSKKELHLAEKILFEVKTQFGYDCNELLHKIQSALKGLKN